MTTYANSEAQMIDLVRNALLVAGQEMGEGGDHWPVIKSTIQSITDDWEKVQIERNVFNEVRNQFQLTLKELETLYQECPKDAQPKVRSIINGLLEIYHACFAPVEKRPRTAEDLIPVHLQRAKAIIKTLEDDNG